MNILASFRNFMSPVAEINEVLPREGIVYEVGSGYGTISKTIAQSYPRRRVIGIDINKSKIKEAREKFHLANLSFVASDALTYKYKQCKGIVLSDFLHHLNYEKQAVLLQKLSNVLEVGGVIIIKEIDSHDGWRKNASRLWDFILYPHAQIYYREKNELINYLRGLDLKVQVSRKVPWFPGSIHLFICTKK